jgi:hypothetical protein
MPEAFSFSREFDFVRLDGLRRATGRPPHEWDLYIVKELIDNALDADETLWRDDPTQFPRLHIRMEYIKVSERRSQQLFVQVSNRTAFPVEQMADIFATQWYTSRKAFIKGLTRGALGNALKTLLGIPYALRNRLAGDWSPDLKPLSILCNGTEYLPRYVVDSTAQTIKFDCETKDDKTIEGTVVSVGLDHFEQEMPRTLAQVELLAEQYHLCNPHAEFHWTVEIEGQECTREYVADLDWVEKFRETAPVQWYSPTAFQDLLGALYRKQCGDKQAGKLPVEIVCRCFAGFDGEAAGVSQSQLSTATIIEAFGKDGLTKTDIEDQAAAQLYRVLYQHSPRFDSAKLGCIGPEHVRAVLSRALPADGDILYGIASDAGNDPNIPFVIEAAAARLKEGKRQMWTAINFAPTYGDPFLRRWLRAPIQPDEPVMGLCGLLDAYGLRDETPVVLFLHLICPNIEHDEFSKTEINHLPFKQVLGDLLDRLLTALRRAQEDEELRLEQAVFRELDAILGALGPDERFVFDQLLEKLRARLSQDPALAAWLETPDSLGRLRAYITSYQSRNAVLTHHVARPAAGTLSIPLHPDRHFSVMAEYVSRDLLTQHHVNKVLYVQVRELEPVVIENGWLCRMDMALLRNPPSPDGLEDALVQCAVGSNLPILVLHNADEAERAVVEQMRTWLEERHLSTDRIVDLGLDVTSGVSDGAEPTKLVEMMPGELVAWLMARFEALGIPAKSLPADTDIRRDIRERVERMLLGHLWEGVSQQLEVIRLLGDLDRQLHLTEKMITQALDEKLKRYLQRESCAKSYAAVLEEVVQEFFEGFMREHGAHVRELAQEHLAHVRGGWER